MQQGLQQDPEALETPAVHGGVGEVGHQGHVGPILRKRGEGAMNMGIAGEGEVIGGDSPLSVQRRSIVGMGENHIRAPGFQHVHPPIVGVQGILRGPKHVEAAGLFTVPPQDLEVGFPMKGGPPVGQNDIRTVLVQLMDQLLGRQVRFGHQEGDVVFFKAGGDRFDIIGDVFEVVPFHWNPLPL